MGRKQRERAKERAKEKAKAKAAMHKAAMHKQHKTRQAMLLAPVAARAVISSHSAGTGKSTATIAAIRDT